MSIKELAEKIKIKTSVYCSYYRVVVIVCLLKRENIRES